VFPNFTGSSHDKTDNIADPVGMPKKIQGVALAITSLTIMAQPTYVDDPFDLAKERV
jgi:hypothetical protein